MIQSSYLRERENKSEVQMYTETWFWNPKVKEFEVLYPSQPGLLSAKPKQTGTGLLEQPGGRRIVGLGTLQTVYIQHLQTRHGLSAYAKVLTDKGQMGFIPLDQLEIKGFKQTNWLTQQLEKTAKAGRLYSLQKGMLVARDSSSFK